MEDEDVFSLSDKVPAQGTLPSLRDSAVQNAYQREYKRHLSAILRGLRPNISTAVQLHTPKTMDRAIEIANTVHFTFKSKMDTDDAHM